MLRHGLLEVDVMVARPHPGERRKRADGSLEVKLAELCSTKSPNPHERRETGLPLLLYGTGAPP